MLDIIQFRQSLVRPVLQVLDTYSKAAENLLLGTAVQESRLQYLRQLGDGPACGLYQMEPATHDDIWDNYLAYQPDLRSRIEAFALPHQDRHAQLIWNLAYATAMCRIHYRRVREALPDAGDADALARYWKRHYNTERGSGTVLEFKEKYLRYVMPSDDIAAFNA
jgi:hypothetical protein